MYIIKIKNKLTYTLHRGWAGVDGDEKLGKYLQNTYRKLYLFISVAGTQR